MVILQFNKLIRNKWIWGAFAVVVSLAFCSDGCFRDTKAENQLQDYGKLGDAAVDAELYDLCRSDIEFLTRGSQRDIPSSTDINKQAWKQYAAIKIAEQNGIQVSDAAVAEFAEQYLTSRGARGELDPAEYERILRDGLRTTPARFEAFCRRMLQANYVKTIAGDVSSWVSPMETEQAAYDSTDSFTVRVADFVQTEQEAAAVKVDDATFKAWYDENKESIKLPDLRQVKYVKLDAANKDLVAEEKVSETAIQDYYDKHFSSYRKRTEYTTNSTELASIVAGPNTTVVTNGEQVVVTVTDPIEKVKDAIKDIVALEQIVRKLEKSTKSRLYAELKADETVETRLATFARGANKIETSGWFTMGYEPKVDGFMVNRADVLKGVPDAERGFAQLKMGKKDPLDRFAVVSASNAVYVVALVGEQKSHIPTWEETKDKTAIRSRAVKAEQEKAFKNKVAAFIAEGKESVLKHANASTNQTFSASDTKGVSAAVRTAAQSLKKGEISEFIPTASRKASVVICDDRVQADRISVETSAEKANSEKSQMQMFYRSRMANDWSESYLNRVGFTPSRQTLVVKSSSKDE